jgi:hypothetical protein
VGHKIEVFGPSPFRKEKEIIPKTLLVFFLITQCEIYNEFPPEMYLGPKRNLFVTRISKCDFISNLHLSSESGRREREEEIRGPSCVAGDECMYEFTPTAGFAGGVEALFSG